MILSDVCELIIDCEHKTAPIQQTGYPSIRTPNIGRGRLILDGVNRVSEEIYQMWTRRAVPQEDDLILAREAPVGNVAIIPKDLKVCLGQRTVLIRPDREKINPHYLLYTLLDFEIQGRIRSLAYGVTVHHLNVKDIRNLDLPKLPSRSIQDGIASILSAYDDLIENNNRRIALLEKAAQLLYEEWFVRLRFPGYEHTKIVDGVPEGWNRTYAPDVITFDPKTVVPKDKENWFVEMACLSNGSMIISDPVRRLGNSGSKFINGDTLLARITPCLENGKTGFVNCLPEGQAGFGSTEFIVMRGKKVPPTFVYCFARSEHVRGTAIKSMIGASGRQRVQRSCFNDIMVPLPPKVVLSEFDDQAGKLFEQIKLLNQQTQKLKQARDLLLPKLMSGEVSV